MATFDEEDECDITTEIDNTETNDQIPEENIKIVQPIKEKIDWDAELAVKREAKRKKLTQKLPGSTKVKEEKTPKIPEAIPQSSQEPEEISTSNVEDEIELRGITKKDIYNIVDEHLAVVNEEILKLKKSLSKKDEEINIITRANVQLVLVEMDSIASDINRANGLLLNIGTEKHFESILYEEKNRGINMAHQYSKRYLEQGASNARKVMPILESIKITLDKLNEKIIYIEEA